MLDLNKRIGLVAMVVSPVLAAIAFMMSKCEYCNFVDGSLLAAVMYGFKIQFGEDLDIPTKYFLFIFLGTFGIGLLFYLGALTLPSTSRAANSDNREPP